MLMILFFIMKISNNRRRRKSSSYKPPRSSWIISPKFSVVFSSFLPLFFCTTPSCISFFFANLVPTCTVGGNRDKEKCDLFIIRLKDSADTYTFLHCLLLKFAAVNFNPISAQWKHQILS